MLLTDTDSDIDLLVVDPPMSGSDCRRMMWSFMWVSWGEGRPLTVDTAFPVLTPVCPLFHSSKGGWHSGMR